MRVGDETLAVQEWAYTALCASVSVREALGQYLGTPVAPEAVQGHVWPDVAPPGVDPVIVLSPGEGLDVPVIGPYDRLFSAIPLNVRAVGQTEAYDLLGPIARAIYRTLHGSHNAPVSADGMVLTCMRQGPIQYPEESGSIQYRHLGHQFQVNVQ